MSRYGFILRQSQIVFDEPNYTLKHEQVTTHRNVENFYNARKMYGMKLL